MKGDPTITSAERRTLAQQAATDRLARTGCDLQCQDPNSFTDKFLHILGGAISEEGSEDGGGGGVLSTTDGLGLRRGGRKGGGEG